MKMCCRVVLEYFKVGVQIAYVKEKKEKRLRA